MYLIGFNDVQQSEGRFPLLWPAAGVVKLCQYAPTTGNGETVTEQMKITLEGTKAAIEAWKDKLERTLAQARQEADIPGGNRVYLAVQITNEYEEPVWRSPLLDGRVLLGPAGVDQRGAGSQLITLEVKRADWWERDAAPTPWMENPGGNNEYDVVFISNHTDSGHYQYINVPAQHGGADNIIGGLPPDTLMMWGAVPAPDKALTVMICEGCRPDVLNLVNVFEGEACAARAGVTGTAAADATCSAGNYKSFAWNGAAEQELLSFDLGWAEGVRLGGYPARVVMRLQDSISTAATEKFWYRWKIFSIESAGEMLVGESPAQYMEQGQELIFGSVFNIPPWLVDLSFAAGPDLRFVLTVQAAGTGAHALKVDSITVAPCEGWRIYRPINNRPTTGLIDRGSSGIISDRTYFYPTHTIEGPGFVYYPGQPARFWVFVLRHDAGEKSAPIDFGHWLAVGYHPRRRSL